MTNHPEIPLAQLVGPNRAVAIVDSLIIHGEQVAGKLEALAVRTIQFPHLNCLEKSSQSIAAIICCLGQINSVADIVRPYASARRAHVPLIVMPTQTRMSAVIQKQILKTDGTDRSGIIIELVPKLDSDRAIELLTQGLRQMTK